MIRCVLWSLWHQGLAPGQRRVDSSCEGGTMSWGLADRCVSEKWRIPLEKTCPLENEDKPWDFGYPLGRYFQTTPCPRIDAKEHEPGSRSSNSGLKETKEKKQHIDSTRGVWPATIRMWPMNVIKESEGEPVWFNTSALTNAELHSKQSK